MCLPPFLLSIPLQGAPAACAVFAGPVAALAGLLIGQAQRPGDLGVAHAAHTAQPDDDTLFFRQLAQQPILQRGLALPLRRAAAARRRLAGPLPALVFAVKVQGAAVRDGGKIALHAAPLEGEPLPLQTEIGQRLIDALPGILRVLQAAGAHPPQKIAVLFHQCRRPALRVAAEQLQQFLIPHPRTSFSPQQAAL